MESDHFRGNWVTRLVWSRNICVHKVALVTIVIVPTVAKSKTFCLALRPSFLRRLPLFHVLEGISKPARYLQSTMAKFSKETKQRLQTVFQTGQFVIRWGFIPTVLYLGFARGGDPGMPEPNILSLLWG
uniref:Mitochondrial import receptor subunit TOM7 homolog n=3 Tax=Oncorhynchus TaxID=8016 RepID=A0AAZ3RIZ8_ONCTS